MKRLARLPWLAVCVWIIAPPLVLGEDGGKKTPVPPAAAQTEALKLVKEIYGPEYAKADSPMAKQTLAKTLLEKAKDTPGDPAGKFVLLRLARDVATQALDGPTAFQAIDALAETFEIDPIEMKALVLKQGASHAKTSQHHKAIMEQALKQVDGAIAEDNYAVARQLCDLTAAEATAANDDETKNRALERGVLVENTLAVLYEKAQNAAAMLKADPVNAQANAAVGKYLCFVKGDWDMDLHAPTREYRGGRRA